ncbi:peptidoglycan-recognition protein LC [Orussus abietinus]|uniref:peptidoglycan-recognition protein LC n=1 Tax=Orussus abietinus TaxID=222816 RepID=UPI000626BF87|nr:peptidoglycan-recognition protein LC [Orussus abietinus]
MVAAQSGSKASDARLYGMVREAQPCQDCPGDSGRWSQELALGIKRDAYGIPRPGLDSGEDVGEVESVENEGMDCRTVAPAGSSFENESLGSTRTSDDEESVDGGGWTVDGNPTLPAVQHFDNGVALPFREPENFGSVNVKNSSNVHVGSKTFYKGPVTIKQFVYTNQAGPEEGAINYGLPGSPETIIDVKSAANGGPRKLQASHCNYEKVVQWLWSWRCAISACSLAMLFITAMTVTFVILTQYAKAAEPTFPQIPDSALGNGVVPQGVRFVERDEWGAQPPVEHLEKLKLPVEYVVISHTATDFCSTQSQCTYRVRMAQTFHIEAKNWSDIGYNFLVGGDGLAYVGRSWNYVGAHAFGYNFKSIGISFIGTFIDVLPPKKQIYAAQKIIEIGVDGGKIAKDYKLIGHCQAQPTVSPGNALYAHIKTWPHWCPDPVPT